MTIYTSGAVSSPHYYAREYRVRELFVFLRSGNMTRLQQQQQQQPPRRVRMANTSHDCGGGRDAKRAVTATGGYRLGGAHAFQQQAAARDRGAKPLCSAVAMTISARKKCDTYLSVSLPLCEKSLPLPTIPPNKKAACVRDGVSLI